MKNLIKYFALALSILSVSLLLTSCGGDDDASPSTANNTPLYPDIASRVSGGIDAALWAINIDGSFYTPDLPISFDLGTAVGIFFNGSQQGIDAGSLSVDASAMTFSNGAYIYLPNFQNPGTSLAFGSSVDWALTGSKNGFSNFTITDNTTFPIMGTISSGDITAGQDYTITLTGVSSAEGVIYLIAGGNGGYVYKEKFAADGGLNSCTFTAAELSKFPKGSESVLVEVVGFNYTVKAESGKNIVLGKEKALIKYVKVN